MNTSEQTPVAVVGVGRMGRHHARIYHQLPQAQLLAVVDADLDRAGALADEYNCDALASVEELIAKYPQVKAVSVAAPTIYHQAIAEPLLKHGTACLIEKPLAQSVEVAEQIVKVGREHNTLVQVGHTERFNPALRAIADLDITPRFIEVDRISPMTFRSTDVGVVFDMMIHDLDIVLMLTGQEPTDIRAAGVNLLGRHEDVANARLQFPSGCVANITASRVAMKTERRLRLFSESAYISINFAAKTGVIISKKDNAEALNDVRTQLEAGADLSDLDYTELINYKEIEINDEEPLTAQLSNFLVAASGEGEAEVTGDAGLAAVRAAQQVVDSIREHTWADLDPTNPV